MADLGSRDEPRRGEDDHAVLLSELDSHDLALAFDVADGLRKRVTQPLLRGLVPAMNPHFEFFDAHDWGYSVVEFTREDCTWIAYSVDKHVDDERAERSLVAAYRVPEGEVDLRDVSDEYRD